MSLSNHTKKPLLQKAQVTWNEENILTSEYFQDIYFAKAGALAESTHVFIQGNKLPERWTHCQQFVIAELGFGTGLNFVNTVAHWLKHSPAHAHLHYISAEYFPLSPAVLETFWQQFPEHASIAKALLQKMPSLLPGVHRISFPEFRCTLTLLLGEAAQMYQEYEAQVDAWYLDGFAPAKNPELWTAELLREVYRLSKPGATLATYSVARAVQENLISSGFQVEKKKGFAQKKEMLTANKSGIEISQQHNSEKTAIIVGGSLAGSSAAYALSRRGWHVTVLEKRSLQELLPLYHTVGICYPLLSSDWNLTTQFYCNSVLYTLRLLADLHAQGQTVEAKRCGMKILATRPREQERFFKLQNFSWMPEDFLQFFPSSQNEKYDTILMPHGTWIKPFTLVNALLQQKNIQVKLQQEVTQLEETADGWKVYTKNNLFTAAHVIIANAFAAKNLAQTDFIDLKRIRGQITYIPALPEFKDIQSILCAEGYLTPAIDEVHHLGASYDLDNFAEHLLPESHQKNLAQLKYFAPKLAQHFDLEKLDGRVGFRTVSRDRMPLVGAHPSEKNLWLSLAHGSRGLISCPLAGELLASQMNDEPLLLPKKIVKMLAPDRFYNV